MSKEAAFAHAKLLSKRADREALQALRGGNIDGAGKDGFASAEAFGLPATAGLFKAFLGGRRAQRAGHENTLT